MPVLVSLTSLTLYVRTMAPGLTWAHAGADGGDFLSAALTAGVPHPTGYPAYQLLLRAAVGMSPANPALAGNALSALCTAMAAGLLADLARRMQVPGRQERPGPFIAAMAGLAWAAAPAVWGQATITEAYALNALVFVAVIWLLQRWSEVSADGRVGAWPLIAAALIGGLGMGNHLTLALALPAVAISISHRGHSLPSARKGFGYALLAFSAGLLVYAYLPVAAAGGPPVNWADASTPRGFAWLVTGRLYAPLVLGLPPADLPARGVAFARDAGLQFGGPWTLVLALTGLASLRRRRSPAWRSGLAVVLAYGIYAVTYGAGESFVYLLPAWAIVALWLAAGLGWTIDWVAGKMDSRRAGALAAALLVAAFVFGPGLSLSTNWRVNDLSQDREAESLVRALVREPEPDAVVLVASDGPTFAAWYAYYGLKQRADVAPVNINLLGFAWYRDTLQRWHPSLFRDAQPLPDTAGWLRELASVRPVYRAEPLGETFTGLREEPAGQLIRLLPATDS